MTGVQTCALPISADDAVFDVPDGLICGNYSSGRIELTIKCGGGLSSTECCYIRHGGVVLGLRVGIDGADVGNNSFIKFVCIDQTANQLAGTRRGIQLSTNFARRNKGVACKGSPRSGCPGTGETKIRRVTVESATKAFGQTEQWEPRGITGSGNGPRKFQSFLPHGGRNLATLIRPAPVGQQEELRPREEAKGLVISRAVLDKIGAWASDVCAAR